MPVLETKTQRIPLVVSTGSFWPADTRLSLEYLFRQKNTDIELTLQSDEFIINFDHSLNMPLLFELTRLVEERNLNVYSLHAPHMHAEHAHSYKARMNYLQQTMDVACMLGAHLIVVHPFHIFTSHEDAADYLKGGITNVEKVLLPGFVSLLDQADTDELTLSLENIIVWQDDELDYFNNPGNIQHLLTDLSHPAMSVTLDMVHAHIAGGAEPFLDELYKDIVNIHMADIEEPATRIPPGEGEISWDTVMPLMAQLPNLRQVTIELSHAMPKDVKQALNGTIDLWSDYVD